MLPIGLTILLVLSGYPARADAQAAQLKLAWLAPTTKINGTPLADLAGYKLYYGRTGRQYEAAFLVGNQTSYTLIGLSAGQIYYIAVTAYNTAGRESLLSEELSVTPLPALESFVRGFYRYGLGREPSAPEVSAWIAYLEANPTLAGASTFIHEAFNGPEYHSRPVTLWSHVTALYQAILGRPPQPEELAYGVDVLLTQTSALLPFFIQSAEFRHLVPDCQDPSPVAALITRLYLQALGRILGPSEV